MRSEVSSASVPQVSSPQAFDEIIIEEGKAAPIFELNLSIDIEMVKEEVAPFDNAEVSQIEEEKSEDSISINDTSTKVATVAKKAPRKKKQAKKTKKKAAAAAKNNTKRN
jgi:topoisomerase IA-like protein